MGAEDRPRENSPLHSSSVLAVAPGVLSRSSGSEMVLLEPASEQFFGLAGVGARIFELLHQARPLADLFDILLTEYDIDRSTLEADVRACVADLMTAKLLRVVAD